MVMLWGLASAQRLAAIGDWGAESAHRSQIAASMRAAHAAKPFEALLTLGDNFYPSGQPVQRYVDELPKVRIYPVFGNHDVPALEAQFRLFGVDRTYYTVRLGNLEIFVLYSEHFDPTQKRWLEGALAASTAPWKVVALHRPLYSSGMHGGSRSLRQALEPLLSQYKVRLVLSGHDHDYERSTVRGITYIVSGGGGASLRGFKRIHAHSQVHQETPNYLGLEATPTQLTVTAYNEANLPIDQVVLKN
ncbi:MAG: metallophosphoesterase [Thermaceae bacterium]|nr:metallophosphoesterase [Thermaceae bacterium]